ncbi:MAG TPA: type II secretion system protein [bacterium]|nr:type II secretion system protein [bacterium]
MTNQAKNSNDKRGFIQHHFHLKGGAGFTLIEILVAMFVFSLITGAVVGVFVSGIKGQRKVLSTRDVLDQTSYFMEYMSRAIRMARKEENAPTCLSSNGLNYEITRLGKGIKFNNYEDPSLCQEFFWDDTVNRLKELKDGDEYYLTSKRLKINSFNIVLSGENQTDNFQPRVTIFLDIQGAGSKPELQSRLRIQTSISQRNIDVVN